MNAINKTVSVVEIVTEVYFIKEKYYFLYLDCHVIPIFLWLLLSVTYIDKVIANNYDLVGFRNIKIIIKKFVEICFDDFFFFFSRWAATVHWQHQLDQH